MTARRIAVGVGVAAFTLVVVAVPTDLIANPVFTRQVPPPAWAWPVAIATAILAGVLVALPRPATCRPATRTGIVGAGLAYLAVGCPTCNHLVMLALGASGTLAWFAPVQPFLALAGLAVLAGAVAVRYWSARARSVASGSASTTR